MNRFNGKVAIVAGGASGIGLASARRLASEGATVVVADLDLAAAEAAAAGIDRASAAWYDAEDPGSVRAMIDAAVGRAGRLDVLHNNAALLVPEVMAADTAAGDIDLAVWDRVMAVNLRGYLAATQAAIPHLVASGGGAVVNTASGTALAGDITRTAYGTSKGAVLTLTQYVATQYGSQGVRCNAIAVGLVRTPSLAANAPWLEDVIKRHTLIRRIAEPEDIAAAVAFLASDDAAYVTGHTLVVDGGLKAHQPYMADVLELMREQDEP
jgi:NAD(P)-dependent dehydrogenase (short-subunit alcohol dehydrogenase family)